MKKTFFRWDVIELEILARKPCSLLHFSNIYIVPGHNHNYAKSRVSFPNAQLRSGTIRILPGDQFRLQIVMYKWEFLQFLQCEGEDAVVRRRFVPHHSHKLSGSSPLLITVQNLNSFSVRTIFVCMWVHFLRNCPKNVILE